MQGFWGASRGALGIFALRSCRATWRWADWEGCGVVRPEARVQVRRSQALLFSSASDSRGTTSGRCGTSLLPPPPSARRAARRTLSIHSSLRCIRPSSAVRPFVPSPVRASDGPSAVRPSANTSVLPATGRRHPSARSSSIRRPAVKSPSSYLHSASDSFSPSHVVEDREAGRRRHGFAS